MQWIVFDYLIAIVGEKNYLCPVSMIVHNHHEIYMNYVKICVLTVYLFSTFSFMRLLFLGDFTYHFLLTGMSRKYFFYFVRMLFGLSERSTDSFLEGRWCLLSRAMMSVVAMVWWMKGVAVVIIMMWWWWWGSYCTVHLFVRMWKTFKVDKVLVMRLQCERYCVKVIGKVNHVGH